MLKPLHDDGLLFQINRVVLHPLGLALVLSTKKEHFEELFLYKVPDPDGYSFSPETFNSGVKRFDAFMKKEGFAKHEARMKTLGYLIQEK